MRLAPSRCTGGFSEALRLGTTAFLALVAACSAINPARAVTIDWVTVGDQGNASQSFWFGPSGAVAYDYRIMKYEWTNSSYLQFLNAIDPQGINPNNVFKQGSSYYQGIVRDSLNPDGSKYVLRKQAFADKPVNYVNWFDAARVANWLHNGSPTYVTSDASANAPHNGGAYSLGTATSGRPATKNPGALFYIPTNDEWHKAAYYKGGGTDAGYWNYPTQSNTEPTPITPIYYDSDPGIGSAGPTGNFANFFNGGMFNGQLGNVSSVGTNGGPSAYGTFDQAGNVQEWTDTRQDQYYFNWFTGQQVYVRTNVTVRGGSYGSTTEANTNSPQLVSYSRDNFTPDYTNSNFGFRLASLPTLTVSGSQIYVTPVSGIVTTGSGAPQFNSGFTGSLTVTGGTATLGGSVAGTVTVAAGAAANIASGASLTNAKVSLAQGGILSIARGTSVPIAAGNIGGISVSGTSGLAVNVLAGTVAADTTIFATTSPKGNFSAAGGSQLVGDVLTFQGTGTATWVLQMQYDPATLPQAESLMASAGELFLSWRNPATNRWVKSVDGNIGGSPQLFQRAWQAGDALGSYGVDVTSNTVWAVINHNSDFAVVAVPEPTTLALAVCGLACTAVGAWRRRKRA
jgi:formylglycine-generating enzyme required for sulfatase activity